MIFQGCTCLRSALPLARARSAPTKQCTNRANGAPIRQLNAVSLVGAAETAAPPDVCSKSVIRVSSVCSAGDDFYALKFSQKKLCDPPPNPMQI